ncbi:hypothetical protein BJ170DRAFT_682817 [Xylariales sp. AK1849]|nr:hypothetical protein BJ170DRAFT_682817 [Xylariales sp. AK1849]
MSADQNLGNITTTVPADDRYTSRIVFLTLFVVFLVFAAVLYFMSTFGESRNLRESSRPKPRDIELGHIQPGNNGMLLGNSLPDDHPVPRISITPARPNAEANVTASVGQQARLPVSKSQSGSEFTDDSSIHSIRHIIKKARGFLNVGRFFVKDGEEGPPATSTTRQVSQPLEVEQRAETTRRTVPMPESQVLNPEGTGAGGSEGLPRSNSASTENRAGTPSVPSPIAQRAPKLKEKSKVAGNFTVATPASDPEEWANFDDDQQDTVADNVNIQSAESLRPSETEPKDAPSGSGGPSEPKRTEEEHVETKDGPERV